MLGSSIRGEFSIVSEIGMESMDPVVHRIPRRAVWSFGRFVQLPDGRPVDQNFINLPLIDDSPAASVVVPVPDPAGTAEGFPDGRR